MFPNIGPKTEQPPSRANMVGIGKHSGKGCTALLVKDMADKKLHPSPRFAMGVITRRKTPVFSSLV